MRFGGASDAREVTMARDNTMARKLMGEIQRGSELPLAEEPLI